MLRDWIKSFQEWMKKHCTTFWVLLLYIIIATGLMAPLASDSLIFSETETPPHLGYLIQAKMALEEGQFPLRVAPIENNGLRYAAFQFYSQIPYFLGGLIYKFLTPHNPYIAYKMILSGALICGGFFIYKLSLWLTRNQIAATLAGVSYMAAPYFLVTIHARGAFTELCGQGLIPFVLYYVIICYNEQNRKYFLLSSFAWFTLAITHIITFIYGSLFIGLFGILLLINNWQEKKILSFFRVFCAYVLSWLLAAYFLVPVALNSGKVTMRINVERISPYVTNWMTPLSNLLSPTSIPPVPIGSEYGLSYGVHPSVGWIFLAAWGVVAYYYFSGRHLPPTIAHSRSYILPLLCVFLIVLFITWSPIDFWAFLPKSFWVTQFTFRFLTHIMWSGALLTGYALAMVYKNRLNTSRLLIGILLIVMAGSPWLPAPKGNLRVDQVVKDPQFRIAGAMDYLNRTPETILYGNAQLRLLTDPWISGFESWSNLTQKNLLVLYPDEPNWQIFPLWQHQDNPVLHFDFQVPLEILTGPSTLTVAAMKGKAIPVAKIPLDKPEISVTIPFKKAPKEGNTIRLQYLFEGKTVNNQRPVIKVKNLYFEGISPENTVIPITKTQKQCQQKGVKTLCQITVGKEAQVVQLPVLYYSEMQQVKVNGKSVPYFSVYHYDYSLTAVRLNSGTYDIETTFIGLSWANWISMIAAIGWIIGMIIPENIKIVNHE